MLTIHSSESERRLSPAQGIAYAYAANPNVVATSILGYDKQLTWIDLNNFSAIASNEAGGSRSMLVNTNPTASGHGGSPASLIHFAFMSAFSVFCTFPAVAQSEFSDPARNFKFTLPKDWHAAAGGNSINVTAPDESRFTLSRDSLGAIPGGDPSNNAPARAAAERMAGSLLSNSSYAGVRQVTVDTGAGAAFRFRGKGPKSNYDLVEVWVAVIGRHTVTALPEKAGQPDHAFEMGTLFRTLSFADPPAKTPAAGNRQASPQAAKGKKKNEGFAAAQTDPAKLTPGRRAMPEDSSMATSATTEMERYEGKLRAQDLSFILHLNHNGTALAEYSPTIGTAIRYSGSCKGQDGNYLVNLTRTGAGTDGAKTLTLTLRGLGGMETGTYTVDASSATRNVAELKLVSADTGATGKGMKNNRSSPNRNMRKRNRPGGRPPGFRSSLRNRSLNRRFRRVTQI